jgi:hypothetical protein
MKVICELCGRFSTDPDVCSACGAPIGSDDVEQLGEQHPMEWGWAEISIDSVPAPERSKAVEVLRKEWAGVEGFTILRLMKSQAEAFAFDTAMATVLVRRDLLGSIIENAQKEVASIAFTFTPVNEAISTAEEADKLLSARG